MSLTEAAFRALSTKETVRDGTNYDPPGTGLDLGIGSGTNDTVVRVHIDQDQDIWLDTEWGGSIIIGYREFHRLIRWYAWDVIVKARWCGLRTVVWWELFRRHVSRELRTLAR